LRIAAVAIWVAQEKAFAANASLIIGKTKKYPVVFLAEMPKKLMIGLWVIL
jgi:hypothetical protein